MISALSKSDASQLPLSRFSSCIESPVINTIESLCISEGSDMHGEVGPFCFPLVHYLLKLLAISANVISSQLPWPHTGMGPNGLEWARSKQIHSCSCYLHSGFNDFLAIGNIYIVLEGIGV